MRSQATTRICGPMGTSGHTFSPGEVINAKVTVRQGREDGFLYELACPIRVRRPTDPSQEIYDDVKFLKPVDRVQHRAGEQVQMRLFIVSLGSIGRPNPADGSTTVNVRRFVPQAVHNVDC